MKSTMINIAKDYSRYPAGRTSKISATSGEEFCTRFLLPALSNGDDLVVELDGVIGYGSSFLEEAFGGLVRRSTLSPEIVRAKIKIITSRPSLMEEVNLYIRDAVMKKVSLI
jgi:STAS-like domain of unknown function (DUF4325)